MCAENKSTVLPDYCFITEILHDGIVNNNNNNKSFVGVNELQHYLLAFSQQAFDVGSRKWRAPVVDILRSDDQG